MRQHTPHHECTTAFFSRSSRKTCISPPSGVEFGSAWAYFHFRRHDIARWVVPGAAHVDEEAQLREIPLSEVIVGSTSKQ